MKKQGKPEPGSWEEFAQQVEEQTSNENLHYASRGIMNWMTWKAGGSSWILTSGHQNIVNTNKAEFSAEERNAMDVITRLYQCRWIIKDKGQEGLIIAVLPLIKFDPYQAPMEEKIKELNADGLEVYFSSTKLGEKAGITAGADFAIDVWDYPKDGDHGQWELAVNPYASTEEVVVTRLYFKEGLSLKDHEEEK